MTKTSLFKDKYNLQLESMKNFPVWTREQITGYLHISNETIYKLKELGFIHSFKVSRQNLYSLKDKFYTNDTIIKSILSIDSYFRIHYDEIEFFKRKNDLTDKSIISRNVKMVGTQCIGDRTCNYYDYYSINPICTKKDFIKVEKLLLDLNCSSNSDKIYLSIICYNSDYIGLKDYLDNSDKLMPYYMTKEINYILVPVSYPCFSYIKL